MLRANFPWKMSADRAGVMSESKCPEGNVRMSMQDYKSLGVPDMINTQTNRQSY